MAESEIRVLWNTIPNVYGKPQEAMNGVQGGIGGRAGVWTVRLEEPQNATRWQVRIELLGGPQWEFNFDGPDEQTAEFVTSAIDKALPSNC
jgi:hypothetical protein